MIRRNIASKLSKLASTFSVVTVMGPRQSGKTTLCRDAFSKHAYISLERPDVLAHAIDDPLDLLRCHGDYLIIDEVQRAPELLSYLQVEVDRDQRPGRFVLTGSRNLLLLSSVSQSLAGRTAFLHLLPFSRDEVQRFPDCPTTLESSIWTGGYPPIHDKGHNPEDWLAAYTSAYVERDVREATQVRDLRAFQLFIRLCAGRTGQVLNMASLAGDAGITANTVRSWLGILEMSFVIALLPGWYANPRKRLLKSPKLHFLDTGLCCWLLGIASPAELTLHHARGALFASWVASEIIKSRLNRGLPPNLCHLRTHRGQEIDLVIDAGNSLTLIEAKSSKTLSADAARTLGHADSFFGQAAALKKLSRFVVFGGAGERRLGNTDAISWNNLANYNW